MPISHLVKDHHSFGPDEIKVLTTAFDAALLELGLGELILLPLMSQNAS
jgi:hypothetical protein